MELWYAASLFFGGAFSYWVIAKFMDVTHSYRLMKQVTDQIVLLMISVSQDIAFIKKVKYETMEALEVEEGQIDIVKKIDKKALDAWRDMSLMKIMQSYPKGYSKILTHYNWDKVTKSIDELYK